MPNLFEYLNQSVKNIPNIRDVDVKALERLSITTNIDLLYHLPVRVEKKLFYPNLATIQDKSKVVLTVEVLSTSEPLKRHLRNVKKIFKIETTDGRDSIELIFFNFFPSYIAHKFQIGARIIVVGKIEKVGLIYKIAHPEIYHSIKNIAKLDAIYPLTYGLNSKMLHKYVNQVITNLQPVAEWLPKEIIAKYQWVGWYEAISKIHNPKAQADLEPLSKYFQRLAFDELFASQLAVKIVRKHRAELEKGKPIRFHGILGMNIVKEADFILTDGQKSAITDIETDQRSSKRMMRLLQGDVGSGKTLVALYSMLNVREAGMQSVLMAPTEILAWQHYKTIKELVRNRDVEVALLTGKLSKAKRRDLLIKLKEKKIDILIGTHAIFQEDVVFNNLGLVVIDEQHRFGVQQRMALMNKSDNCDVLIMSATPIPRTLAMSVYGDLDITTIKDKPIGRRPVKTITISESREDEVMQAIQNKLDCKEQVYWVCPLIKSQNEDMPGDLSNAAAEDRFLKLRKIFGDKVEILHGKMTVDEKEAAMQSFIDRRKLILVSTTVIEVGVNVPNATLLIVEKADKFGLSQLHQLRGRVGRSDKQSHCILLFSKFISKVSFQRLKVIKESDDGFYIAEQDFKLRGGGDMIGNKQSGLPDYKIANLEFHIDLLFEAGNLANDIVKKNHEGQIIYKELIEIFHYQNAMKYSSVG